MRIFQILLAHVLTLGMMLAWDDCIWIPIKIIVLRGTYDMDITFFEWQRNSGLLLSWPVTQTFITENILTLQHAAFSLLNMGFIYSQLVYWCATILRNLQFNISQKEAFACWDKLNYYWKIPSRWRESSAGLKQKQVGQRIYKISKCHWIIEN